MKGVAKVATPFVLSRTFENDCFPGFFLKILAEQEKVRIFAIPLRMKRHSQGS